MGAVVRADLTDPPRRPGVLLAILGNSFDACAAVAPGDVPAWVASKQSQVSK